MKEYFKNNLFMEQYSEKIENNEKISYGIGEQCEEKVQKENKKLKKENKNNSQMSFMTNFLNMNKNLNSNNDDNINNSAINNENNEQKVQSQSNNNNNNIEKNELIKPQFIIKESNIKNNTKNIFKSNLLEKKYEKSKDDSSFMNQKRHFDLKIDMFFDKRKKIEDNKLSENKEFILNNNENNNINNNNDIIKKSGNYSLENKEKKSKKDKKDKIKDKKLNIDKFQKEDNKKSENINMSFKLNKNGRYNINKDEVMKNYLNLIYSHPLDENDEYEVIKDKEGKEFYLCKICRQFFNSKYSVRKHQWSIHLKPFREIIQRELKSEYKNKFKI
jgi:hypothetical protein